MTGFLRGLFGSKPQSEDTTVQYNQPDQSGSYFLDADSAKTFGNVDYMRSAKTIRRTFPKVEGDKKEEMEQIKQVSAMTEMNGNNTTSTGVEVNGTVSGSATKSEVVSERRRSDSSMDMFRNMARDIKR